jgi:hypothetical protein
MSVWTSIAPYLDTKIEGLDTLDTRTALDETSNHCNNEIFQALASILKLIPGSPTILLSSDHEY